MDYKTMTFNDIVEWCKENNQVEWLKTEVSRTITTKEGKERNPSYIEVKRNFVLKFMPEIAPKPTKKNPTMLEIIANL